MDTGSRPDDYRVERSRSTDQHRAISQRQPIAQITHQQ